VAQKVECLIYKLEAEFKPQFQKKKSWALVAHACNLSYSGGRDQVHSNTTLNVPNLI
jgi:hypothetical protein